MVSFHSGPRKILLRLGCPESWYPVVPGSRDERELIKWINIGYFQAWLLTTIELKFIIGNSGFTLDDEWEFSHYRKT